MTTIARRRKLDMVSALEAALESPQLPPEARDRIQAFLRLHRAASNALERMRADVFVRRLIERVGLRRHRLFAASPETAERLVNLSRLAELAADWSRREPRGSVRDFVRHLTAVADAGELGGDDSDRPIPGAVLVAEPEQVKGLEFDHVYLLGLRSGAVAARALGGRLDPRRADRRAAAASRATTLTTERRLMLAHVAMTRARLALVLSWARDAGGGPHGAVARSTAAAREALGGEEEIHEEELFGPAEGLHSTYRMLRDEVLEASWRAGSAVSEMRLDTVDDVNTRGRPVPGADQARGADPAARARSPPPRRSTRSTSCSAGSPRPSSGSRSRRRRSTSTCSARSASAAPAASQVAARREPSLEQFLPRRKGGLGLSASDIDLYRTCPLKYKFARVFAIPQEPTINQRFGILIHQVLERFHAEEIRAEARRRASRRGDRPATSTGCCGLFEAGWRRQGFGASDDELQYRDRAVAALARYHEQPPALGVAAGLAGAQLRLRDRPAPAARARRPRRPPARGRLRGDRLQDRRPGLGPEAERRRPARALPARRPRGVADRGRARQLLVRARRRARLARARSPTTPSGSSARCSRSPAGSASQDFEPRPSHEICSWCDYRLICPASEA